LKSYLRKEKEEEKPFVILMRVKDDLLMQIGMQGMGTVKKKVAVTCES